MSTKPGEVSVSGGAISCFLLIVSSLFFCRPSVFQNLRPHLIIVSARSPDLSRLRQVDEGKAVGGESTSTPNTATSNRSNKDGVPASPPAKQKSRAGRRWEGFKFDRLAFPLKKKDDHNNKSNRDQPQNPRGSGQTHATPSAINSNDNGAGHYPGSRGTDLSGMDRNEADRSADRTETRIDSGVGGGGGRVGVGGRDDEDPVSIHEQIERLRAALKAAAAETEAGGVGVMDKMDLPRVGAGFQPKRQHQQQQQPVAGGGGGGDSVSLSSSAASPGTGSVALSCCGSCCHGGGVTSRFFVTGGDERRCGGIVTFCSFPVLRGPEISTSVFSAKSLLISTRLGGGRDGHGGDEHSCFQGTYIYSMYKYVSRRKTNTVQSTPEKSGFCLIHSSELQVKSILAVLSI